MNGATGMLNAFLALAIVGACGLIGYHFTSKLSLRQRILSSFIELLDCAASRMQYSNDDLSDVFSDSFTGYRFVKDQPFAEQWMDMIGRYKGVLNQSDADVLVSFSDGIGASDLDTQLRHIALYQSLLTERLEDAKKEQESKAALYRVLPFSIGLTLAILLL